MFKKKRTGGVTQPDVAALQQEHARLQVAVLQMQSERDQHALALDTLLTTLEDFWAAPPGGAAPFLREVVARLARQGTRFPSRSRTLREVTNGQPTVVHMLASRRQPPMQEEHTAHADH